MTFQTYNKKMKQIRSKRDFNKDIPLMPLIKLPPIVGFKYHVQWGSSNGVVGKVVSVDELNQTVIMRSPKSKRIWKNPVRWSDLRLLRKEQLKIIRSSPIK
jgi:hypothetical protein